MTYLSFLSKMAAKAYLIIVLCIILLPLSASAAPSSAAGPLVIKRANLPLIQPLDDRTRTIFTTNPNNALEAFIKYFNIAWPWVLGCSAGVAVLQAVIGGMQIMLSGSGNASSAGKERLMWALAGLLLIGLSGMILEILSPIFFVQG